MGVLASRPAAFAVFLLYGFSWIVFGNGLEWHSLATLATWGMTLVIQRAEHRDTQAIHAKPDELLKGLGGRHQDAMGGTRGSARAHQRALIHTLPARASEKLWFSMG